MRYYFTSNQTAKVREMMASFVKEIGTLHDGNKDRCNSRVQYGGT